MVITVVETESWRELRDERGKLYARIDPVKKLLEVRRNQKTIVFDLGSLLIQTLYPTTKRKDEV